MKIAVGNDHAGFPLRDAVMAAIRGLGHEVVDFGTATQDACDYPDVVVPLAAAVVAGECDLGILFCGTGIGMSIAANKVKGIYAARCEDCYAAEMARAHNSANVLTMGGRTLGPGLAEEVTRVFLTTAPLNEERHQRRQQKVRNLEG
ncbi:MAG TPA: ribose 5-phosphate isomerase B [Armatimonadota bacterium]|jgi:ribose 5-phosphate isomerase B